MIYILQGIALLCGLGGIVGSIAPVLPGPLLSLIGIFLIERTTPQDRSLGFLITMTLLTIVTMVVDYILPLLGTKKYGGSKAGVWGSTLGLILGMVILPPRGMLILPLVGSFLGEYRQKKDKQHARRAARGSFIGSTLATVIKLIVAVIHTRYIIQAIW